MNNTFWGKQNALRFYMKVANYLFLLLPLSFCNDEIFRLPRVLQEGGAEEHMLESDGNQRLSYNPQCILFSPQILHKLLFSNALGNTLLHEMFVAC